MNKVGIYKRPGAKGGAILQPWQIADVKAAIAEADAGRFATDSEIRTTFDALFK